MERDREFLRRWRQVLANIRDQMLRACLPSDPSKVHLRGDTLTVEVDSAFKKSYILRKLPKLTEAVEKAFGPVKVEVGEPPLVEELERGEGRGPGVRITVVGIGAGGINALGRIRAAGVQGVQLVAMDTDSQLLSAAKADLRIQLGEGLTRGRSTGGDPGKGEEAAQEAAWAIRSALEGADLVFLTCGLGGGTGTGAAPVVAAHAREAGALTVGIVTLPFGFEGSVRRERAQAGLERLKEEADVVIVIDNDRLLELAPKDVPLTKAFEMADEVLRQGVQGISDLITVPGLVNLDFADLAAVLRGAGTAMMGVGEAEGEGRAMKAAKQASSNPLLEGGSIRGARKVLLNITGGEDLTLAEVTQAAETVRKETHTEAELLFGAVVREEYTGTVRVTLIAASFQELLPMEEEETPPPPKIPPKRKPSGEEDYDVPAFMRRR